MAAPVDEVLWREFEEQGMIHRDQVYTLKDGTSSTYYIDLRLLISYPEVLDRVATALVEMIVEAGLQYDLIAGVPLAGVPLATLVCHKLGRPGLLIRKEPKQYGRKKLIEGVYRQGQRVLLIDDVVTSAASKREVAAMLREEGLVCNEAVVVVARNGDVSTDDMTIHSLIRRE